MKAFDIMPKTPTSYKEFSCNTEKYILPHVAQWLKSFNDAKFIITDSFHGTVFAIIFNRPFIVVGNKERGLARFTSLLRLFKLEDRLVDSAEEAMKIVDAPIDWKRVNSIKLREKEGSLLSKKKLA